MSISSVTVIPRLGVDGGNRQVKMCMPGKSPWVWPSCILRPQKRAKYKNTPDSRRVEYLEGPAGERGVWIVGRAAKIMQGIPTFSLEDKTSCQIKLALAAIPTNVGDRVQIEQLRLCLPNADYEEKGELLRTKLVGRHVVNIDGSQITADINDVHTEMEGFDAYKYLLATGFYPKPHLVNGIIDFGGGNIGISLYYEGVPILEGRDVLPGTKEVASLLQTHPDLDNVEPNGNLPKVERLLDAIHEATIEGGTGLFIYGSTERDFTEAFNEVVFGTEEQEGWLTKTQNAITNKWGRYFSDMSIGDIALIGGAARTLGSTMVKGRIRVPEDPQFATVRGMVSCL